MHRRIVVSIGIVTLLALVSTCGSQVSDPSAGPDAPEELELRLALAANLEPFGDCDELLDYFREAAEEMGTRGLRPVGGPGVVAIADGAEAAGGGAATRAPERGLAAPAATPTAAPTDSTAGGAFSGTNVQEAGVDEPDLVKTDGRRIVAVAGNRLHLVDARSGGAQAAGSLALPEGSHELFLHDDRAIVLTRSWQLRTLPQQVEPSGAAAAASTIVAPGAGTTIVSAIDLADPDDLRVVDDATFEGDYVTARLHAGTLRLVLRSWPAVFPTEPLPDAGVDGWLPTRIVDGGGEPAVEPLVDCEAVVRPPEPSGVGTVTLLTIDPAASMDPLDADTVVADAQTVYASTDTLYVATNAWVEPEADAAATTTELHAFDISDPEQAEYLASGRVRGQLLNQWSLSERDGYLRVATTDGSPWAPAGGEPSSESFLTVLARDGDRLSSTGQVGNLGRGETIHAVRFVGDLAFVVTFRRVDPLYALDLSDPSDPRVLGELKITGFSAYLHPLSDDLLLGVGQEATDEGRAIGTQVSLFDVSIPTDLARLDQEVVPDSHSPVENDHRAFLWWPAETTAVVPIEVWGAGILEVDPDGGVPERDVPASSPSPAQPFVGALVLTVDGATLDVAGRVTHQGHAEYAPIQRSLVVGDTLYTVSDAGVMGSDLDTLTERAWAAF